MRMPFYKIWDCNIFLSAIVIGCLSGELIAEKKEGKKRTLRQKIVRVAVKGTVAYGGIIVGAPTGAALANIFVNENDSLTITAVKIGVGIVIGGSVGCIGGKKIFETFSPKEPKEEPYPAINQNLTIIPRIC